MASVAENNLTIRNERIYQEVINRRSITQASKKSDLSAQVIEILKIPSANRSALQLEFLKTIMQIKFFADLEKEHGEDIVDLSIRKLKHVFYKSGDTVFNLGERGRSFFVIIRGSVGVYLNLRKKTTAAEETQNEVPSQQKNQPLIEQELTLTEVNILHTGAYFGELALLSGAPRAATIVCKEDTSFAVLDFTDFKNILGSGKQWKIQKDMLLSPLYYSFQTINLLRNQVVYKEGDNVDYIYIVRQGEIKLLKQANFVLKENTFINLDETHKHKLKFSRPIEIAVLGSGETFGEEDAYTNTKRQVSAVCFSKEAELFAISLEDFNYRVLPVLEFTDFFNEHCQNKLYSRNQRIEQMIKTKDINKAMLYGNQGLQIEPSSTKSNSPDKANMFKQKRGATTPNQRITRPSIIRVPQQSGPPITSKILSSTQSPPKERKSRADTLNTENEFQPVTLSLNQQNVPYGSFMLTTLNVSQSDSIKDISTKPLNSEACPPSKPQLARQMKKPSNSGNKNQTLITDLDNSLSSPSPPNKLIHSVSPAKTHKNTPKNVETAVRQNSFFAETNKDHVNGDINRRHLSNKTASKIYEHELIKNILESKEKVMQELNMSTSQFDNGSDLYKNLIADASKRLERKTKLQNRPPSRKMTLSERIQTNDPRSLSAKREINLQSNNNIHMEQRRMKTNVQCFFKTQTKVIKKITNKSLELSYVSRQTQSYFNYYNPTSTNSWQKPSAALRIATSENDLSIQRNDSSRSCDSPLMIRALVNSKQAL